MELNRTQHFLIEFFNDDLNDEKFNDLKFMLNKFFKKNAFSSADTKRLTDVKTTIIHHSTNLLNTYSKLIEQFPDNPNVFLWKQKQEQWKNYLLFVDSFISSPKSDIKIELDVLMLELRNVLTLQNVLLSQCSMKYN